MCLAFLIASSGIGRYTERGELCPRWRTRVPCTQVWTWWRRSGSVIWRTSSCASALCEVSQLCDNTRTDILELKAFSNINAHREIEYIHPDLETHFTSIFEYVKMQALIVAWWTDVSEVACHDIVWSAKSGAIAANHIEVGVERDDSLHKYTSLPLSVRQGLRVKVDEILSSEENTYNIKNISQSFGRLAAAFSLATSRHVQLVTYIQMTSCNHVFFADHRY